ncbi:MAG TPA: hypothetical protein VG817_04575 [Gemmatimonadales bacterium]|nr:hypothetical protein [Gemmatimonadales bacterium]
MKILLSFLLTLLVLTTAPVPAVAQAPDSTRYRSSPFPVKYGKWILLAGALGMGYQAAQAHDDAEAAFDRLEGYCFEDRTRCERGQGGRYADPRAEALYQTSLSHDRTSRRWLIGGEISLLGAAGLFVWELSRPKRPGPNIPFEPTVGFRGARTEVGVSIGF